jgi:hypothetical protein
MHLCSSRLKPREDPTAHSLYPERWDAHRRRRAVSKQRHHLRVRCYAVLSSTTESTFDHRGCPGPSTGSPMDSRSLLQGVDETHTPCRSLERLVVCSKQHRHDIHRPACFGEREREQVKRNSYTCAVSRKRCHLATRGATQTRDGENPPIVFGSPQHPGPSPL